MPAVRAQGPVRGPYMPRRAQLAQLGVRLLGAARAHDWSALESIDRELSRQLPQLAGQGPWSASEQAALQTLGQAHAAALQACTTAGEAMARHIAQLRAGRDGWLAYAAQDMAQDLPAHESSP